MHTLLPVLEIISLLVIAAVLIIGVIKLVVRTASEHNHAQDIARERYARGEITKEEFDRLSRELR